MEQEKIGMEKTGREKVEILDRLDTIKVLVQLLEEELHGAWSKFQKLEEEEKVKIHQEVFLIDDSGDMVGDLWYHVMGVYGIYPTEYPFQD